MSSALPINVEHLLRFRGVEQPRVELKADWSPFVGDQVLRTVCAFANDLQNLSGGYIVIGVEEKNGLAELPPRGLSATDLQKAQRWIRANAKRIEPEFQPILAPETVDGKLILVVWAYASNIRPHQAPESSAKGAPKHYYVRLGSETVQAKGEILTALMQQASKVPFDDRRASGVPIGKLRDAKVREFLTDVGSSLVDEPDVREIYRKLRLTWKSNGHEDPLNVALLFFAEDPEEWFRGARIEVAQFTADAAGDVLEERTFRGALPAQLRDSLTYLKNLVSEHVQKADDRPEARRWTSYPFAALEEAVVNAIYHRSYESSVEPTKVYIYPDRIEIISYPGPVFGIDLEHFRPGARIPPAPVRNRRIGELLKELELAEARGTGVRKVFRSMNENGSPEPTFDFDSGRSYFRVTLPAHTDSMAISALRDAASLKALHQEQAAIERLEQAFEQRPESPSIAATLIDEYSKAGRLTDAREVFSRFRAASKDVGIVAVARAMATALPDSNQTEAAQDPDAAKTARIGSARLEG